jgi:hypothetical protein
MYWEGQGMVAHSFVTSEKPQQSWTDWTNTQGFDIPLETESIEKEGWYLVKWTAINTEGGKLELCGEDYCIRFCKLDKTINQISIP